MDGDLCYRRDDDDVCRNSYSCVYSSLVLATFGLAMIVCMRDL